MTASSRSQALEDAVGMIQLFHTSFEAPRLLLSIYMAIEGPLPRSVNGGIIGMGRSQGNHERSRIYNRTLFVGAEHPSRALLEIWFVNAGVERCPYGNTPIICKSFEPSATC